LQIIIIAEVLAGLRVISAVDVLQEVGVVQSSAASSPFMLGGLTTQARQRLIVKCRHVFRNGLLHVRQIVQLMRRWASAFGASETRLRQLVLFLHLEVGVVA
jgi:hypothetical protein